MRVLVADPLDEAGLERLRQGGVELDVRPGLPREALLACIGGYEAVIVRSETRIDAEVVDAGRRLVVIGRAGTGVDNIDVDAATRRGIVVVNAPEANTVSAAEHTLAMMLAVARRIPWAHQALAQERRWERRRFVGVQLAGKTLGLIGLGRIGSEVARRARAFGMNVLAYDPYVVPERAAETGVELVDLDDLLGRSDFISIHCPLTARTRHLIDAERLRRVRRGAYLINCARGGIVDEAALAEALREGILAGAAIDVFAEEPPGDNPLLGLPNVVVTPHLGASTQEAQSAAALAVAEEVLRVLAGDVPRHAVNVPAISPERWAWARPYLDLGRRLGRVFTELFGLPPAARIEIVYRRELAHAPESQALTAATLWGILSPITPEGVSMANARLMASRRGIEVVESHSRPSGDRPGQEAGPAMLVQAQLGGQGPTVSVGGDLGPDRRPRLLTINGYRVHIEEPGHLLVSEHMDRPGIIGTVGTLLGRHRINIAYMQLGRDRPGGQAVMVLGVDAPVPEDVLRQLRQIPDLWNMRAAEW
ncbi:MAG TPA: phosphoglycerate dehydrogenase [Limnochordales bacterium]